MYLIEHSDSIRKRNPKSQVLLLEYNENNGIETVSEKKIIYI